MITRQRAIELVESYLAVMEWPGGGPTPEPAVYAVEEHSVGWLAFWESAAFVRTGDARFGFGGGGSHVLVDREDGSLHFVPNARDDDEGWEDHYLLQVKGVRRPDPLAAEVRALARSAGAVAAMGHLRKRAPGLSLRQARSYLTAVRDGAEPPEELASLTRKAPRWPLWPVETLAGPVEAPSGPVEAPSGAVGTPSGPADTSSGPVEAPSGPVER
ncbi:Immunity protein 35 [Streptomyces sp. TLI_053]|uniref:YrhB domain-containing protein n=1 Tax=Streptomyces sp. TLI_053 TaxID=1855352 RepID=UPI00087B41A7|nr:YrhB domain-containing protein [Streptomyces sp. TLI_053]SDT81928.1 Immunity protein 35 [Streptomyces sp. TLI_053]